MVREQRFDVSEMAIATFLQAKAFGKPLVLLPIVLAARFQEKALLCRAGSDIASPADLAGRRVGVRAYSQTTGLWLRGVLADDFGIEPARIRWVTFEDAHVAEYRDPPWVERAAPGKDLMAMLGAGELDAVIVGNDVPDDPALRTVFADTEAAASRFRQRHGLMPVNHLVAVLSAIARQSPDLVAELVRLFGEARSASTGDLPFGRNAVTPAVALALRYATAQGLLPRPFTMEEVWDGLPPAVT
jgi:4,5-dihydroxyphthalate decarboxylase